MFGLRPMRDLSPCNLVCKRIPRAPHWTSNSPCSASRTFRLSQGVGPIPRAGFPVSRATTRTKKPGHAVVVPLRAGTASLSNGHRRFCVECRHSTSRRHPARTSLRRAGGFASIRSSPTAGIRRPAFRILVRVRLCACVFARVYARASACVSLCARLCNPDMRLQSRCARERLCSRMGAGDFVSKVGNRQQVDISRGPSHRPAGGSASRGLRCNKKQPDAGHPMACIPDLCRHGAVIRWREFCGVAAVLRR